MGRWLRALLVSLTIIASGIVALPQANAQSGALYFPATGHHLTDTEGLLSFWQAHDGARLLGFPVSEASSADGLTVQYFERARLEAVTDATSGERIVRTGEIGREYAEALYRTFPVATKRTLAAGELRSERTGHTLRAPFLAFWQNSGGQELFGEPISEALWELTENGRRQVQYFERARLERDPNQAGGADEIVVGKIGAALALLRGIDTSPIANWGADTFGPAAAQQANVVSLDIPPTPVPTAVPPPALAKPKPAAPAAPAAPAPRATNGGKKLIVVNLTDQWLYAYESGEQVYDAPISTGRDGMNTPTGTYDVYAKLKKQTMDGVDNGVPWEVPNVPNVMYINGGVALHGTYWHNKFGTGARLSHGCVNLPLKAAAWLFDWAPLGTTVEVTY